MNLIKVDKLSFRYESQMKSVFEDVSLKINSNSRIGLIGSNGCGKSTLINILLKKLKPVSGNSYFREDLSIGFLPQELQLPDNSIVLDYLWSVFPQVFELKKKIEELDKYSDREIVKIFEKYEQGKGYDIETKIEKTTTRFGFDYSMLHRRISELSGGEKTKLALSRILLKERNLLLLDEPTNHLDIDTLKWLEKFLKKINIAYLIISHDRKFLDNCVEKVMVLQKDGISEYSGNYSFYKKEQEKEIKRKLHQYEVQKKKIKKLKLNAQKRKQWAYSHQPETGRDGYAPVYESLGNESKHVMKQAMNLQSRLEKKIEKAETEKPFIEKERKFHFDNNNISSEYVLRTEKLGKSYNSTTVFKEINLQIKSDERLAIIGKNGCGKTTFLRIVTGKIENYQGDYIWSPQAKIGYYSQEYETLDFDKTILEQVVRGNKSKQTFARTVLGCLKIGESLLNKSIDTLSLGERSKVALAQIIVQGANVLVLDEPTNHLEISAREALEKALLSFPGTIIFASHDRYLINKLATIKFELN
ncbi:MAG: ABC-F type ribosomal protection protein [Candidatus Cloacimonetes bacterium]|nr:ABC-F type ribosomal protection protein [Candidatus Cloacimonadota bacterium]MBS3767585.1 ABC-F type ribosomal protection protein [Candidatus Cloacimonadota bacterium]